MQARDTVYITPAEWRWVVLFAGALIGLAFAPFLWVALTASESPWQFMGILNNYRDGATYLSKMIQGSSGGWLVHFQHTPENHNGALIQVIYPALGHVARLVGLQPIALFHAARVVASLIMYMALYHLGATIWTRLRTRRIFFVLISIGGGLGWFFSPLTGEVGFPDLTVPEMFPFYSSLVNIHFPLALACLALLASIVIVAFRPGCVEEPRSNNSGLIGSVLSFALALLYPQALLPFGVAFGLYVVVGWLHHRRVSSRELRWLLAVGLPAVPVATYYVAAVTYNPAMAEWNRQNVTPAPSVIVLVLGLGIPLLMALPGIFRAVRRYEPDGDQFMLIWLAVMLVLIFLPTNIQRRFAAGMMIPLVYFATRALEDFWFNQISRRWRYRLLVVVLPPLTLSFVLLLLGNLSINLGPFLQRDYAIAFQWLRDRTTQNSVVLASEEVSLWVPAWTGARVVYGHPFETLQAGTKRQEVIAWYSASQSDCAALLTTYSVNYVIYGPLETELGSARCVDTLELVEQIGSIRIYAP